LVAAALAEEAALREHDDRLYPGAAADADATASTHRLHAAWRRWSDDAESLLDRLGRAKPTVARSDELERAVGRAKAMLKLAPERMNERRRQARDGQTLTGEEVRRALNIPCGASHASPI
jgi:hypothetical protein